LQLKPVIDQFYGVHTLMASYLKQIIGRYQRLGYRKTNNRGFTLTELLISIVISSIIIATLLYVIVELLGVNSREESLTQTQQDMRRALDYINSDVSESVWVYADPTAVANQITDAGLADPDANPVLAFWRVDPIDTSDLIDDSTGVCKSSVAGEECDALLVRQYAHTLVVYFQEPNSEDDIWEGPRRIIRYELSKYSDVSTLSQRTGYVDPTQNELTDDIGADITFANWERDGSTTDGIMDVLTDYVDGPTLDGSGDPIDVVCPPGFTDVADSQDNFYVCVSGDATVSQNRSILVYLRGSAFEDNQVVFGPASNASRLPTLKTEIFVRGVVEEQPDFDD
jgi:prepilin-type N-terminal cleavage/methylation domain-containing protein